jgi:hypothetical protein
MSGPYLSSFGFLERHDNLVRLWFAGIRHRRNGFRARIGKDSNGSGANAWNRSV